MSNDLISRNAVVAIIEKNRLLVGKRDLSIEYKLSGVQEEIENLPAAYDTDEVALAMEKQVPYRITYQNGFGYCKCGCEFEREGYEGEEYCPECGQKVWVGGYNGQKNKIVSFAEVENETN